MSPPIVIDPLRGVPFGFAATVNGTEPGPWPEAGCESAIQSGVPDTAQVQSRSVAMASVALPPPAANDAGELVAVVWHFEVLGDVTDVDVDVQPSIVAAATAAKVARNSRPDARMGYRAQRYARSSPARVVW